MSPAVRRRRALLLKEERELAQIIAFDHYENTHQHHSLAVADRYSREHWQDYRPAAQRVIKQWDRKINQ